MTPKTLVYCFLIAAMTDMIGSLAQNHTFMRQAYPVTVNSAIGSADTSEWAADVVDASTHAIKAKQRLFKTHPIADYRTRRIVSPP